MYKVDADLAHGTARFATTCWTQRSVWTDHYNSEPKDRHEHNVTVLIPLPAASGREQVERTVQELVRQHEALRTTFPVGVGPKQVVLDDVEAPFTWIEGNRIENANGDGPLRAEKAYNFDLARELPVRAVAYPTATGRTLALVLHHIAIDGWSVTLLKDAALGIYGRAPSAVTEVSSKRQPSSQLDFEASADGAARAHAALEYWRATLARTPASMFPSWHDRSADATNIDASIFSTELAEATRAAAAIFRTLPSLVYMTAFNLLMSAFTGNSALTYKVLSSNRTDPSLREVVGCVFLPALYAVDVGVDDHVADVAKATLASWHAALQHGYMPYDRALEAASLSRTRTGSPQHFNTIFNHVQDSDFRVPNGISLGSVKYNEATFSKINEDAHFRVREGMDGVEVQLTVDRKAMNEAEVFAFLEAYVATVLDLAAGGCLSTVGVLRDRAHFKRNPAVEDDTWVRLDESWINLRQVEACLRRDRDVRDASVQLVVDVDGHRRLLADITASRSTLREASLRSRFLDHMNEFSAVAFPTILRVRAAELPATDVDQSGDGDDPRAVAALVSAMQDLLGLSVSDIDRSYIQNGGRLLDVPALREHLDSRGWRVPPLSDIVGPNSLRAVIAGMQLRAGAAG